MSDHNIPSRRQGRLLGIVFGLSFFTLALFVVALYRL